MELQKITIETLNRISDNAADNRWDDDADYMAECDQTINWIAAILRTSTIHALKQFPEICQELDRELEIMSQDDDDPEARKEMRGLIIDLCRCGYFDEAAGAQGMATRKIKTRKVDGVSYDVGY